MKSSSESSPPMWSYEKRFLSASDHFVMSQFFGPRIGWWGEEDQMLASGINNFISERESARDTYSLYDFHAAVIRKEALLIPASLALAFPNHGS